ncbi:MAG: hypothetical protein HZA91_03605 [Verrucomicrobia bacterium]|nr:hypothetical protein [Verrucomicrobiota bacterium]
MRFYLLIFDRQFGKSYKGFHDAFVAHQSIYRWWHYLKNSYIIGTDLSVGDLSRHAGACFEQHQLSNTHLILSVDLTERQGMLPPDAWKWIRENAKIDEDA